MVGSVTVEPYGNIADIAFWPLILLLAYLAWRFRAHRIIVVSCALSALAIFVIGIVHDYLRGSTSHAAVHDLTIGQCIVGGVTFMMFAGVAQQVASNGWPKQDRILGLFAIAMGLVFLGVFVAGTAVLVRDLAWPWYTVEGEVTSLHNTVGRVSWKYVGPNFVRIGDTQVQASTRLYRTLRVGQHVRAQVSRGSDFIRRLERIRSL